MSVLDLPENFGEEDARQLAENWKKLWPEYVSWLDYLQSQSRYASGPIVDHDPGDEDEEEHRLRPMRRYAQNMRDWNELLKRSAKELR